MTIRHQQYNSITASASGTTNWIPVDPKVAPFELHVLGEYAAGSNLVYTVEYTSDPFDEITDSASAVDLPEMVDLASTVSKAVIAPITGVRLNVTSYTSGSVTLKVRQAGVGF